MSVTFDKMSHFSKTKTKEMIESLPDWGNDDIRVSIKFEHGRFFFMARRDDKTVYQAIFMDEKAILDNLGSMKERIEARSKSGLLCW